MLESGSLLTHYCRKNQSVSETEMKCHLQEENLDINNNKIINPAVNEINFSFGSSKMSDLSSFYLWNIGDSKQDVIITFNLFPKWTSIGEKNE